MVDLSNEFKRVALSLVLGWTISWAVGLVILISAFLFGFAKKSFSYPIEIYIAIFVMVTAFSYLKIKRFSRVFISFLILSAVLLLTLMVIVTNQNPDVKGFVIEVTPWSVNLEKP